MLSTLFQAAVDDQIKKERESGVLDTVSAFPTDSRTVFVVCLCTTWPARAVRSIAGAVKPALSRVCDLVLYVSA